MRKLYLFLILLALAIPAFSEGGWEGFSLRGANDTDASVDPADEYTLEYDTTTELWIPVARLEAEDLSTDTTNFDGILSAGEDTIQSALDVLDDISITETDPIVGAITGIPKADGAGNISQATAGIDYLVTEVDGSTTNEIQNIWQRI